MRRLHPTNWLSILFVSIVVSQSTQAATYWVAKDGKDSSPCSEALPCLTIQHGVDQLAAGDTLNIKQGIYAPRGFTDTGGDVYFFQYRVGVLMKASGTASSPIVIQADPAAPKSSVIIDQNFQATGFYFSDGGYSPYEWPDYIHIKNLVFRNILHSAITSHDRDGACSDPDSLVSRGVLIEGNEIYNVNASIAGTNNAAVRMDSSRGWIIRNNKIDSITVLGAGPESSPNSGILEAYNIYDALVENNEFSNAYTGVYWKESPKGCPTYPSVQSTVRNNKFTNIYRGIDVNGSTHAISVYNIIENNVFSGYSIAIFPNGIANESVWTIRHNFFDEASTGFSFIGSIAVPSETLNLKFREIYGNIFHNRNKTDLGLFDTDGSPQDVQYINENIYTSEPIVDFRSGITFYSLEAWQTSNHPTVSDQAPDVKSKIHSVETVATSTATGDYKIPASSPVLGFMSNGDNAGPYQKGNEVIGRILVAQSITISKPRAPNNLQVQIE